MIEAQLSLDKQQSPEIIEDDIKKATEDVKVITSMEVSDVSLAKIAQVREENTEFGDYVINYIEHQAPNEMISRGFALGVVTTYSVYEQAFKRLKSA